MLPKKFPIKKNAHRIEINHRINNKYIMGLVRYDANAHEVLCDFLSIDPYMVGKIDVICLYGHRPITCTIELSKLKEAYETTLFS